MSVAPLVRTSAAVALLLGAGSVLVAPAASAAPQEGMRGDLIGLSSDGRQWSQALTDPLFDPQVRWVPGDARSARFYVRNQAEATGDVRVSFSPTVSLEEIDDQALEVEARAGRRPWREVSDAATADLLAGEGLAAGQSVPVDLRVRMRYDAANTSMRLRTGMELEVTVADARAGSGSVASQGAPGSDRPGDGYGLLPQTGTPLTLWQTALAGGLVLVGAWLLLVGRRRRAVETAYPPSFHSETT